MKRTWHDYSLGWVLLALFLLCWIIQSWTGWREFESEQRSHQAPAEVFGTDGYMWTWGKATFENWQSEFLQVLAFASLTSLLIYKGSPESRDNDDELKAMLARVEHKLDELQVGADPAQSPTTGATAFNAPDLRGVTFFEREF
jgi:hypothetical protein